MRHTNNLVPPSGTLCSVGKCVHEWKHGIFPDNESRRIFVCGFCVGGILAAKENAEGRRRKKVAQKEEKN